MVPGPDHTSLTWDDISVDPRLRAIRQLPTIQIEPQTVYLAGGLPLHQHTSAILLRRERRQGNCRNSRDCQQQHENLKKHPKSFQRSPQYGSKSMADYLPLPPQALLRHPGHPPVIPVDTLHLPHEARGRAWRIETPARVAFGEEKFLPAAIRCPAKKTMHHKTIVPFENHDITRIQRFCLNRSHHDTVARMYRGAHATSPDNQSDRSGHFSNCQANSMGILGVHSVPLHNLGLQPPSAVDKL